MPKPRSAGRSFLTESPGGFTDKGSHQNDHKSKQHDIFSYEHPELSKSPQQGSMSTTGTFSRGKKQVPEGTQQFYLENHKMNLCSQKPPGRIKHLQVTRQRAVQSPKD